MQKLNYDTLVICIVNKLNFPLARIVSNFSSVTSKFPLTRDKYTNTITR